MNDINLVDYYANQKLFFQRMSAYSKLAFFIMLLIFIISSQEIYPLLLVFGFILLISLVGRIPVAKMTKWALYPAFFASIFAFSQFIAVGSFPFVLLFRAYVAAFLTLFYSFTTPYFETFGIVSKLSPFLGMVLFFTYRYFFVFLDVLNKKITMVKIRGAENRKFYSIAKVVGFLILEMIDRAERIHSVLQIRGFKEKIYFKSKKKVNVADFVLVFTGIIFLIINFYLL